MLICCADSCERILKYDKIVEKHELTLTALKGGTDSSQIAVFGNDKQTVGIKVEDLFDGEGNVFRQIISHCITRSIFMSIKIGKKTVSP